MSTNRLRLEFATAGFLSEMRKQFAKLHPDQPSPIKGLLDYPPDQRSALMSAVERSIQYAGPDGQRAFDVWAERRANAQAENQEG
jgi:hypothetical protein